MILTELSKSDFDKILGNYNIGKHKSHKHIWWAFDNTVYDLHTTKGRYILKIFEKTDDQIIKLQIKVINYLGKNNVPVAEVIKGKRSLTSFDGKKILIQEFVDGKTDVKRHTDKLLKDIGSQAAKMDMHLMKLKRTPKMENWHAVDLEKKILDIKQFGGLDLQEAQKKIGADINKLDQKNLRKSVVHGDLSEPNFIVKNDKVVAFIDFDDIHFDYLVYDPVVFIAHALLGNKLINKRKIKTFLKAYQERIKLSGDEKKLIFFLIQIRLIGVIEHTGKQIKHHEDRSAEIEKWGNKFVSRYVTFSKLSLGDFLKLF